jgi:hypothetical protein
MKSFPGTTRAYWLNEEAGFVQRAQIMLAEEAKEQQAQQRRMKRQH